jgi:Na+-transporting NADH:ubiquinone oxidoreductase subunit A
LAIFRIQKGYDIPISGKPEEALAEASRADQVGVKPPDIRGFNPRLRVQVGDQVQIGTPLAEDKNDARRLLTSPAGGQVIAINRGARRRIEEIVIKVSAGAEESVQFPADGGEGIDRQTIVDRLLQSGLWLLLKQRPFGKICDPESIPQAVFVNAMNTAPLAANPAFQLQGKDVFLEAGLKVLSKLTDGKVHLCRAERLSPSIPCLEKSQNAEIHQFSGPHPAGNVGTHIHHVEPVKKDRVHWALTAVDAAAIGQFFLEGKVPVERVVAVSGVGAPSAKYFRTRWGAPVSSLLGKDSNLSGMRVISGTVLNGDKVEPSGYLGYYDTTVCVIPEGGKRHLLGWLMPGFGRRSFSKVFASTLIPNGNFQYDTSMNGDKRAIVPLGTYEAVMALDIQPTFLFKSILYGDLEEAEKLGLLECTEEDVALCSYVCHSKIDFCTLIRQGLDQFEKEG